MPVVDQHSDPAFGVLLAQVTRMPLFGDFVKEASIDTAPTAPTAYAWPEELKYRIDDEKQAALSYAYYLASSGVPAHVGARIKEALDVYEVPLSLFEQAKTAAAEEDLSDYILPDLRLFRAKSAADVQVAAREVLAQLSKLDLEHRATACVNLVEKAAAHGVVLQPQVMQLAGLVVSSTKVACDWLDARASVTTEPQYKLAYAQLADGLRTNASDESKDRDGLIKLASTIGELDVLAGLVKHYDRKLPDALQTVFNTTKIASQTVDVNGKLVPLDKLAALPMSFWEDLAGPEFARECCPGGVTDRSKMAAVVGTLPLDLKIILRKQLRL